MNDPTGKQILTGLQVVHFSESSSAIEFGKVTRLNEQTDHVTIRVHTVAYSGGEPESQKPYDINGSRHRTVVL